MGPQLDNPDSFGQFLRRERELREIKLEEIASYTRIKLRSLLAIEQDDFASLPPLAFIRAFVRCYADYIGLSIPDVMLRFDGFVQSRYPELTGEVPLIKSQHEPRQPYLIALLVLVVAVLVALAWWMSRMPIQAPKPDQGRSDSGPILGSTGNLPATSDVLMLPGTSSVRPGTTAVPGATAGTAIGDTTTPALQPSPDAGATIPGATLAPETTPAAGATVAAAAVARVEVSSAAGSTAAPGMGPPSSLVLRPGVRQQTVIKAKADCWIGYTLDGVKKGEINLKAGQSATFEARDGIRLIIGNPNAVSAFIHNGTTVDFKPRCSPQHINFPAGPEDKACYPRAPAATPGAAPAARPRTPAVAPATRPRTPAAAPATRPRTPSPAPATLRPGNVPPRPPVAPRTPE